MGHPWLHKSDPLDRFWAKVNKRSGLFWDGTECWLWTARTNRGYGIFWGGSSHLPAHRFAYERFVGPIPDGLTIDHLCRRRACVNPSHLEPVTDRVNTLRGTGPSAQHARKTVAACGHAFDGRDSLGRRICCGCQKAARARRYARDKERAA